MLYIVPAILFILTLLLTAVVYLNSKGKYGAYIEGLDKEEWPLADYLPMGFYLCGFSLDEKLPDSLRDMLAGYKHKVYLKTLMLYGKKRGAERMYFVYQANKAVTQMLIILLVAVFALLGSLANNDASIAYKLWVLGVTAVVAIPFIIDRDLDEKLKKRREDLLMQFPSFGSKLVLLLEAGMTVPRAIRKIVADSRRETALMRELGDMLSEIEGGMAETAAYEEFARRCGVKEINRFISVLIQSMKRGARDMSVTLKLQIQECWQSRKDLARVLGQQASTKLVLPLMLMMLGIIIMIGGPALLMFSQL